ncbi:MAG: Uma2 family endonuclease [Drouetiella hepatica Uher 2000/2452]|jgi:Uma2 family endonuclease|uniref:Uma2 family endonuclease n=1 Tax=Drouetiella hepatica Uher 2000/2452 TaxID=904376 RepID=A0A951QH30_9CYAN|nr:Uma2 family endonuclease [Drouetiella hepatica Uher 2000/2452]
MAVEVRLLTVEDYHRMAEAGIFHSEERVELLAGQVIQTAVKGTAHSVANTRTRRSIENRLGTRALVRVQEPIQLDDYSEPEPDIAIVIPRSLEYTDHHPVATEVLLVIEIADSSLRLDCGMKAIACAKSGIADYWVLDIVDRKLHVFRSPNAEGYQSELVLGETMDIAPLAFPDCVISVREMLQPVM